MTPPYCTRQKRQSCWSYSKKGTWGITLASSPTKKKSLQGTSTGSIFILSMPIPANNRNVFIILPAFNEQAVIKPVIEELLAFNYQVVVVDDGSATGLGSLLKDMPLYL